MRWVKICTVRWIKKNVEMRQITGNIRNSRENICELDKGWSKLHFHSTRKSEGFKGKFWKINDTYRACDDLRYYGIFFAASRLLNVRLALILPAKCNRKEKQKYFCV